MSAPLTTEQVQFLHAQPVARFATVDEAGRPHVVPICFAAVDGAIYTAIDEKPKRVNPRGLRRLRNLTLHPEVCLLVDRYDEDWTQLAWLQVRGLAALVVDPTERAQALGALRGRYAQYRTMDLESLPLVRITPTQVVAWQANARA